MNEKTTTPSLLRLIAAVFLGIIVGFILFLVAAMFIGAFNNLMGMAIPVGMDFTENIVSAILLVIFVIGCVDRVLLESLDDTTHRRENGATTYRRIRAPCLFFGNGVFLPAQCRDGSVLNQDLGSTLITTRVISSDWGAEPVNSLIPEIILSITMLAGRV